jgi:hypothetical protein
MVLERNEVYYRTAIAHAACSFLFLFLPNHIDKVFHLHHILQAFLPPKCYNAPDFHLHHKPVFQILYYNDTIQIVPLLHVYCYNQDTMPFQKQSG